MNNIRLRFRLLAVGNIVPLIFIIAVNTLTRNEFSLSDVIFFLLTVILDVWILVDSVLARRYIEKISSANELSYELRQRLEDTRLSVLRRYAKKADGFLKSMRDRQSAMIEKAQSYPKLVSNTTFLQAVATFKFKVAETMIRQAGREAEEAQRAEVRRKGRASKLLAKASEFGIDVAEDTSPAAIRDTIEQAREYHDLLNRSDVLGARSYVQQMIHDGRTAEAKSFVLLSERLLEDAKRYGVDVTEARILLAYGNTERLSALIGAKYDEVAFAEMMRRYQERINGLQKAHRPGCQRLLSTLRSAYGTEGFKAAQYVLDAALQRIRT